MSVPLVSEGFYTCDYSQELIPVSCIASFSYGGGVCPQYIQVTVSDGSRMSFRVGKIYRTQDHKNCDITFVCDILDGDRTRKVMLYFDRKRDRWFLKKNASGNCSGQVGS
ncbi:MAG: hypothetical protein SOZ59_09570 [Candidatus Limivivens sp.]|nr:hypothetical protein [Candidatus Limivivens sp.]